MLGGIDFDYYGYGYDARDEAVLDYLELDEQIYNYPRVVAGPIPGNDIIKVTKINSRNEVYNLSLCECAEVQATNAEHASSVLGRLAQQHQKPRRPKWGCVDRYEAVKLYTQYCLRQCRILTPEQIDQSDYFPSWKFFEHSRSIYFTTLLNGIRSLLKSATANQLERRNYQLLAASLAEFDAKQTTQQIMDEPQKAIDELVQRTREERTRKARPNRPKHRLLQQQPAYAQQAVHGIEYTPISSQPYGRNADPVYQGNASIGGGVNIRQDLSDAALGTPAPIQNTATPKSSIKPHLSSTIKALLGKLKSFPT